MSVWMMMCAGLALFAAAAVAAPAPTRTALGAEARQRQAIGAALRTVAIPAENYRLSLANGQVWLSWQPTATNCLRRGVGPVGLSLGPAERYDCTGFENVQGDPDARLQFYFDGGYQLRAVVTEPSGTTTYGPVLTALQLWDWARSGATVFGGGYIWAYYLGATPGPQLFQISATTGRLVRRIALSAGTEPFLAYNDYGLWVAESGWGGPGCTVACPLWHVPPGAEPGQCGIAGWGSRPVVRRLGHERLRRRADPSALSGRLPPGYLAPRRQQRPRNL